MRRVVEGFASMIAVAVLAALLGSGCGMLGSSSAPGNDYQLKGLYLEGFDCGTSGQSQVAFHTGEKGCQGVGVMSLTGGQYYNVDLKGAKIAYATDAQNWTRIYVDAANAVQREAAIQFARKYFATFGNVDSVRDARINVEGANGSYTATIDGGNVLSMTVEPVKGADQSHPVKMENTANRLSPTLYQAKILNGSYSDSGKKINFNGVNGFYNDDLNTKGSLGG